MGKTSSGQVMKWGMIFEVVIDGRRGDEWQGIIIRNCRQVFAGDA